MRALGEGREKRRKNAKEKDSMKMSWHEFVCGCVLLAVEIPVELPVDWLVRSRFKKMMMRDAIHHGITESLIC